MNKTDNQKAAELVEFAHAYLQLSEQKKAIIHRVIFWTFAKKAIKNPSLENIRLALNTFRGLVLPDIWRPALLYSLATTAAGLWFYTLWAASH